MVTEYSHLKYCPKLRTSKLLPQHVDRRNAQHVINYGRQRRPLSMSNWTVVGRLVDSTRDVRRLVFTARCYASAVLAMGLCPSVRLSQIGVLLKRLNVGSHKHHNTIAQGVYFSDAKDLREIRPGSPPTGAPNAGGVGQNRRLSINNWLYIENSTRQTHGFY